MKSKRNLFKRISKKMAIFSITMLILQPLLMIGVAPEKAQAANPIPVHVLGIADHVVISEVQISGDTVDDEFVELYNPTATPVVMTGWRLTKITESGGTESNLVTILNGTIPANGFFLIGSSNYNGQVSKDVTYSTNNSIAPNNTVVLYSDAGNTVVDKVGFGTATISETTPFPINPGENQSIERKANTKATSQTMDVGWTDYNKGNGEDTDVNADDFVLKDISEPQNSSSASEDPYDFPSTPVVEITNPVNNLNKESVNLEITGENEAGAIYDYFIAEKDGGSFVTGNGILDSLGKAVLSPIDVSSLSDGELAVSVILTANNGKKSILNKDISKDTVAPIATIEPEPVLGNASTTKIKFTVTTNELWPIVIGDPTVRIGNVWNGANKVGTDFNFQEIGGTSYKYLAEFDLTTLTDADKNVDLTVKTEVKDKAGNSTLLSKNFKIDSISPGKITNLKAVAGNSKVDLSWENPTDSDLVNIQIYRNGVLLITLAKDIDTFSDSNVTNGTTYTYDVYAIDVAGNKSEKTSISATPSAPIVTTSSNTPEVASAISTEIIKPNQQEEIKSEVKNNNTDTEESPKKDTEVKNNKKIPVWGIFFLLILTAVGGYLFYIQSPKKV